MDKRERDLADATAELSETLEALRTELGAPARSRFGLPRPPRPSELLRFTEQYTIPTVIGLLETSIKALELLGAALRVADGRPLDAVSDRSAGGPNGGSIDAVGRAGRDRIARTSRDTLRRLDDALAELQSAAEGDPSSPELQGLLSEARELRAEVDARLGDAISETERNADSGGADRSEPTEIGISTAEKGSEEVGIDVDEELESIKRDLDSGASNSQSDEDGTE